MIEVATAEAIASSLGGISSQIAGHDLATEFNNRMTDSYDLDAGMHFGYGHNTTKKPATDGNSTPSISVSQQSDPVDAFDDYAEDNYINEVSGGAFLGSNVSTFNYCIAQKSDDSLAAVAPVAVPLDQAVVAISQLFGVSMEYGNIPTTVRNSLLLALTETGLLYDFISDTGERYAAAWWDGNKVLFPEEVIAAVEQALEEQNIPIAGDAGGTAVSDLISFPIHCGGLVAEIDVIRPSVTTDVLCGFSNCDCIGRDNTAWYGIWAGKTRDEVVGRIKTVTRASISNGAYSYYNSSSEIASVNRYVYNGKEVYASFSMCSIASGVPNQYQFIWPLSYPSTTGSSQSDAIGKAAWTYVYGTVTPAGEYPEGTSASEAPAYSLEDLDPWGGVASQISEQYGPVVQSVIGVNLPTNSLNTTGATLDPKSDTDPNRIKELPPAPIPTQVPDTNVSNPNVDLVDSSVVNAELIDQLVEDLANTLDPQPEQSSGLIPIPYLPGGTGGYPSIIPSSGPGLIHVYNPTPAEFVSFGNWLWVTYADPDINKIWANPFDGVIGAFELYATPQTDGSDNIRSGFLTCPTTAALVRQRYIEIDCGTVVIPEFYGNYLDYSPYSQCYIYLPFIGINEVSIDDIVGHAVNIRYRVDCYNGSCIAMIIVAKSGYRNLCYQFAGNCAVEVPLAGGSQAAIKAGMIQAEAYARAGMGSAMGSILTGVGSLLFGSIGGLMSGVGSAINSSLNAQAGMEAARVANKATVQHSGQFGSSHGAMGAKKPFIIIRNPIQVKVVNYNDDYGYPAHKRVIVGGCTGYLRVREVNVISAHATDNEKKMIEAQLKAGVYVS